jgi:hypothetical protein
MIDLRSPSFTGTSEEKLRQISDYLFQLNEQLQYAFNEIDQEVVTATEQATMAVKMGGNTTIVKNGSGVPTTEEDILQTFNNIKQLIIKSADIVEAYTETITKSLSGVYVAQSDFGTYVKDTNNKFEANDKFTQQTNTSISNLILSADATNDNINNLENKLSNTDDTIKDVKRQAEVELDNVKEQLQSNEASLAELQDTYQQTDTYAIIKKEQGYMKSGFLEIDGDDEGEYGIEIGHTVEVNGVDTETSCARFTSKRVVIYDPNGNESALLTNRTLISPNVKVVETTSVGNFVDKVEPDHNRVVTRFIPQEAK